MLGIRDSCGPTQQHCSSNTGCKNQTKCALIYIRDDLQMLYFEKDLIFTIFAHVMVKTGIETLFLENQNYSAAKKRWFPVRPLICLGRFRREKRSLEPFDCDVNR